MYFNIEINILDLYSFECEKVHVLVFINYCGNENSWSIKEEQYFDLAEDLSFSRGLCPM